MDDLLCCHKSEPPLHNLNQNVPLKSLLFAGLVRSLTFSSVGKTQCGCLLVKGQRPLRGPVAQWVCSKQESCCSVQRGFCSLKSFPLIVLVALYAQLLSRANYKQQKDKKTVFRVNLQLGMRLHVWTVCRVIRIVSAPTLSARCVLGLLCQISSTSVSFELK